MKQQLNEIKKLQKVAGILKENYEETQIGDDNGDRHDEFWDITSATNFEQAISAFKQAGFTAEDVAGFIQSHWHRM